MPLAPSARLPSSASWSTHSSGTWGREAALGALIDRRARFSIFDTVVEEWLERQQGRQYFKEAKHPYVDLTSRPTDGTSGLEDPKGAAGARSARGLVGGYAPPTKAGAHYFPSPGHSTRVHLEEDLQEEAPRTRWVARRHWRVSEVSLPKDHTEVTFSTTDFAGNTWSSVVPLDQVETCVVVAEDPPLCATMVVRQWFACCNGAWGQWLRSQPLYICVLSCLLAACIVNVVGAADWRKPEAPFIAAVVLSFVALALHVGMLLYSWWADNRAFLCCGCDCGNAVWRVLVSPAEAPFPPPLPKEDDDPFPLKEDADVVPLALDERAAVPTDSYATKREGGGRLCGCSRRTGFLLVALLVGGIALTATPCIDAVGWMGYLGHELPQSAGGCFVPVPVKMSRYFSCEPLFAPADAKKCWGEYSGLPSYAAFAPSTDAPSWVPPPVLQPAPAAQPAAKPAAATRRTSHLASPSPTSRPLSGRSMQGDPTPSHTPGLPNDLVAFACPTGQSALGSVNNYAYEAATASTTPQDKSCGMCKSSFLPGFRACSIAMFLYFLIMAGAYFAGLAPRLPQEPLVYRDQGTAYVLLRDVHGVLVASADVGDLRVAKEIVAYIAAQRKRMQVELRQAGLQQHPLSDAHGSFARNCLALAERGITNTAWTLYSLAALPFSSYLGFALFFGSLTVGAGFL